MRKQRDGKVLVTDGPYIETKEHMGGFWILEAANMDEALAWARKGAIACDVAGEVRELLFYPAPEEDWRKRVNSPGRAAPEHAPQRMLTCGTKRGRMCGTPVLYPAPPHHEKKLGCRSFWRDALDNDAPREAVNLTRTGTSRQDNQMRNVIFAINITLDGCCDHTKINPDDEVLEYFTDLMREVDLQVFGRKTYQLMVPYWPEVAKNQSASKADKEFAQAFDSVNKLVFSRSLDSVEAKIRELFARTFATKSSN